ncbi:MAG: CxxH/CxxC protein [Clostridia bacterium]
MVQQPMNDKHVQIQGKATAIQAEFPIVVSCMEHVEQAIDEYVDDYETAPDTFKRADVEDAEVAQVCATCGQPGEVVLLKEKGL